MGRMTRAKAAEIAEEMHMDEDVVLEANENDVAETGGAIKATDVVARTATPDASLRSPLGEITPNSADGKTGVSVQAEQQEEGAKKKGKGKKKRGKKNKDFGASTMSEVEVLVDGAEQGSGAAEEEGEDLSQFVNSPPARLTRSQLAKKADLEENDNGSSVYNNSEATGSFAQGAASVGVTVEQAQAEEGASGTQSMSVLDAPASPLPSAMPNVIANLRKNTPGKRSTSNKENMEPTAASEVSTPIRSSTLLSPNYDALEAAAVDAATPPTSRRASNIGLGSDQSMSAPDDGITVDELTKAVENASLEVQESPMNPDQVEDVVSKVESEPVEQSVNPVTEEVAPEPTEATEVKPSEQTTVQSSESQVSAEQPKPKAKKPVPVVRGTKASQARLSVALGEKTGAPALGRPRMSTALGRSSSVRQSYAPEHKRGFSASVRAAPDAVTKEKKEVVIPHSKPRPISMSFPTPPPAVRSSKPTTKSTFTLPGEAIAAKLKAQREERMKKETTKEAEEPAKRPAFKARPAPSVSKAVPIVRHTATSKSRESFAGATTKDLKSSTTNASFAHKRASSVFATSTRSTGATKATGDRIAARPSTAMAAVHKSRGSISVATALTAPASGQRVPSGKGTVKGKDVFNRAANARETAEKEKREKEEAAKKARAAAAERGRQLSREWAEKQRVKKLAQKTTDGASASSGAPATVAEVAAV